MAEMTLATRLLSEYQSKSTPFQWKGEVKEPTYITRIDPLSGNVSRISEERARRPIGISANLDLKPVERCDFCNFETSTPQRHLRHSCGAVSVPNLYPWEKHDWVTVYPPFGNHKHLLSDLYFEDMERMIESSYDLALLCHMDPDVISFMDFTNWGAFAGASQQHPHSQRRSITHTADPVQSQELLRCKQLQQQLGRNPFEALAEEEIGNGSRVIYNNDVFIAAAFAPTSSNEIIAFPRHEISNVLQTNDAERKAIITPILGVFPALFFYRGVTDLNIAIHMAPFHEMEAAREYYRWHMHIYPRRHKLPVDQAGAEIGFGTAVIDVLPENCAASLRRWYREGPSEEHLVRCQDGSCSPLLLQELRRVTAG